MQLLCINDNVPHLVVVGHPVKCFHQICCSLQNHFLYANKENIDDKKRFRTPFILSSLFINGQSITGIVTIQCDVVLFHRWKSGLNRRLLTSVITANTWSWCLLDCSVSVRMKKCSISANICFALRKDNAIYVCSEGHSVSQSWAITQQKASSRKSSYDDGTSESESMRSC